MSGEGTTAAEERARPDGVAADRSEAFVAERLARAGVYRLLGRALAYPGPGDAEVLARSARALHASAAPALGGLLDRFAAAASRTDAGDLAAEHVLLFHRAAPCPPYEGAWADAAQLAGKAALLADVAGFYRAFGIEPASAQPDTPDHIAAECEFMSVLALKEAWAAAASNEEALETIGAATRSFLADHLGRWAEVFAGALREASPAPYYGALADLLAACVAADAAALGVTPAALAGPPRRDPMQDEDTFTCPMAPGDDDGETR